MARERAPSFQFYPRDFMADPAVQALTWEQRGRYVWALSCSFLSESPGRATEDQWRIWMGYKASQWDRNKVAMRNCFTVEGESWVQKRMAAEREDQAARFRQASSGGAVRAARMSPTQRSESAKAAAASRWGGGDA